jgi:Family of unknown function (DUF6527)
MAAKIYQYTDDSPNIERAVGEWPIQYWFHCPGCGHDHAFTVGPQRAGLVDARWAWNGSYEKPTFTPSLMCNRDHPESRCHSFVTDGKIQFLSDSHHKLAGQTVELPDWEDPAQV